MLETKIPLNFYQQIDTPSIAKKLIGKFLFTSLSPENVITGGMIIETEAYCGAIDKACHAHNYRRTKRNEVMYSLGGTIYVYLCYGMHNMLNIVTNIEGEPHAILIRAILPETGLDLMLKRRNKLKITPALTSGPGSVCQALGIDRLHNGIHINGNKIWIEDHGDLIDQAHIQATPRIGIDYAQDDTLKPWRFLYKPPKN